MKAYQFSFVSPSRGYRGFKTFDTLVAAMNERIRMRANGYVVTKLQTITR
jgi:hypothetical protein